MNLRNIINYIPGIISSSASIASIVGGLYLYSHSTEPLKYVRDNIDSLAQVMDESQLRRYIDYSEELGNGMLSFGVYCLVAGFVNSPFAMNLILNARKKNKFLAKEKQESLTEIVCRH